MENSYERALRWGVVGIALLAAMALVAPRVMAADLGSDGGYNGGYKDGAPASIPGVRWSGVYVGGSLGYGSDRATLEGDINGWAGESRFDASLGTDTSLTGFIGVLTVGADWHFPSSRLVLGLYGDYTLGETSGSILEVSFNDGRGALQPKLSDQWAVGGRVGVIVTPGTLAYVKLGYTQAKQSLELTETGEQPGSWDTTKGGFEVGGGAEMSLGSGFFLRAEYDYLDYGSTTFSEITLKNGSAQFSEDFSANRFVAGIVYKIGMGQ